jgi:hypothetical protein
MRSGGAINWTVGKLLTIILLVVLLVLVVYGISAGGINPLVEKIKGMAIEVQNTISDIFGGSSLGDTEEYCYDSEIDSFGTDIQLKGTLCLSKDYCILELDEKRKFYFNWMEEVSRFRLSGTSLQNFKGGLWRSVTNGLITMYYFSDSEKAMLEREIYQGLKTKVRSEIFPEGLPQIPPLSQGFSMEEWAAREKEFSQILDREEEVFGELTNVITKGIQFKVGNTRTYTWFNAEWCVGEFLGGADCPGWTDSRALKKIYNDADEWDGITGGAFDVKVTYRIFEGSQAPPENWQDIPGVVRALNTEEDFDAMEAFFKKKKKEFEEAATPPEGSFQELEEMWAGKTVNINGDVKDIGVLRVGGQKKEYVIIFFSEEDVPKYGIIYDRGSHWTGEDPAEDFSKWVLFRYDEKDLKWHKVATPTFFLSTENEQVVEDLLLISAIRQNLIEGCR